MTIRLATHVEQSLHEVWAGFDRRLFDKLNPPFPPVEVVRFDGSYKGDVVHLRLNFLLFRQDWVSLITEQQETVDEIFFVDEGVKLPFFLSRWRHRHGLLRNERGGTVIVDEVSFRTPFRITDYLIYPLLWLQFAYRKPIYRRLFLT